MYRAFITTGDGEVFECDGDSMSIVVGYATQTAREGDRVEIYEVLDGLCGPEVQHLILEYIEDGWKGYD